MKYLLFVLFSFSFSIDLFAQGVNIEQLRQQAKAAGYSDSQIESAIQQVQQGSSSSAEAVKSIAPGSEIMPVAGEKQEPVFINKPDVVKQKTAKFGVDLLSSFPSTFDPNEYGPVPDDYVIGTGDELQLSVWGQSEFYLKAEVDRRGMIQIPTVGLVAVSGLTLKKAELVLSERLAKSYSGIRSGESKFALTISKVRSIRVFVGGFVNKPGAYKLNSIASVITSIYAAGGVTEKANLREIAVIKPDGSVTTIDLYTSLLGVASGNLDKLDHNYIITVKGESLAIDIAGEIYRPGRYDLKAGEGLLDLLGFAGGATPSAWLGNVQILRKIPGEGQRTLTIDARNPLTPVELTNGDEVVIPSSVEKIYGTVLVEGAVRQPGRVEYKAGITVRDAIQSVGGINEWTYLPWGQVITVEEDSSLSIQSFNLEKALAGDRSENLPLRDNSKVVVKSMWQVTPRYSIEVIGFVNSPGKFPFYQGMTLGDAIFLANGFKQDAWDGSIEVSRVDPTDSTSSDRKIAYITSIKNSGELNPDNPSLLYKLKEMDQVYIRKNPYFERQRTVSIGGEVKFPGSYSLTSKDEKLASIIKRAGGLKSTAYLDGGTLFRSFNSVGQIAIDFTEVLKDSLSGDNIILTPGDEIFIPEKTNTVKITGKVAVETSVLFKENASVGYYITEAGGYTDLADREKVYVILPNGRIFVPAKYWVFQPEILSGSTIVVPPAEVEDPIDWKGWITVTTSTLTSVITLIILLQRTQ